MYCQHCGQPLIPGQAVCAHCGQPSAPPPVTAPYAGNDRARIAAKTFSLIAMAFVVFSMGIMFVNLYNYNLAYNFSYWLDWAWTVALSILLILLVWRKKVELGIHYAVITLFALQIVRQIVSIVAALPSLSVVPPYGNRTISLSIALYLLITLLHIGIASLYIAVLLCDLKKPAGMQKPATVLLVILCLTIVLNVVASWAMMGIFYFGDLVLNAFLNRGVYQALAVFFYARSRQKQAQISLPEAGFFSAMP